MKIKDLYVGDRPREKLKKLGPSSLSDFELLQVIIGSGTRGFDVSKIAKEVLGIISKGLENLTFENLTRIKGLSLAKASQIIASMELFKRYMMKDGRVKITSPSDILPLLEDIRRKKQEHFVVASLDGANKLINKRIVTIGILNASLIHPREIFSEAIVERAASIIIAHNHPSDEVEPSREDITLTERVKKAGDILGIKLLDHIIIGPSNYFSFREKGIL